jgi:hypothetical protein
MEYSYSIINLIASIIYGRNSVHGQQKSRRIRAGKDQADSSGLPDGFYIITLNIHILGKQWHGFQLALDNQQPVKRIGMVGWQIKNAQGMQGLYR